MAKRSGEVSVLQKEIDKADKEERQKRYESNREVFGESKPLVALYWKRKCEKKYDIVDQIHKTSLLEFFHALSYIKQNPKLMNNYRFLELRTPYDDVDLDNLAYYLELDIEGSEFEKCKAINMLIVETFSWLYCKN